MKFDEVVIRRLTKVVVVDLEVAEVDWETIDVDQDVTDIDQKAVYEVIFMVEDKEPVLGEIVKPVYTQGVFFVTIFWLAKPC